MSDCTKIPFDSRAAAKLYVRQMKEVTGSLSPYLCPHCDRWHLTSQSRKRTMKFKRMGHNA